NQEYITFANVTKDATIEIYNLNGKILYTISETDGNGGVEWNMIDNNGNKVNTGIYLYKASGKNSAGQEVEEQMGKFAIVR
ncbi:MAG: T9SS type A sorting domain-containing protein, partial [Ignavibacteria bacterium]|nr:T9SS type A sorting domain-containing protein [Ignavibacteria bacterium]